MNPTTDLLALYDALGPDERARLDALVADDPALAAELRQWQTLRARHGQHLRDAVADREAFVLYALAEDDPALLGAADEARLAGARASLAAAAQRFPGLADAVRRVWADRLAFDAAWDECAADAEAAAAAYDAEHPAAEPSPATEPAAARAFKADRRPAPSPGRRSRARWMYRTAVAASVFVFGAILTFVAVRDSGYTELATGPGQTERIELADGSVITLAADSRLLYATEGEDVRHVRLRAGQALFEVTRDEAHPFTVETPAAVTTVLGTTFGVTATDIATDVVLVSGAVEVEARALPGEKVRLAPGEGSRVLGASPPTAPAPATLADDLAWTGKLYVRAEPARSVAEQIGRAMGVSVRVDDALADELVTGTFDLSRPARDVLGLLAATLGADLVEQDGAFRLATR